MYIRYTFELDETTKREIHDMEPKFGFDYFGKTIYYRTYSRLKPNGTQEHWSDTVIRVIEGILSIRKDYMLKHFLGWDDPKWQTLARKMAVSMFKMEWLPPGRGLWACGTKFVREVGSAAMNNCGAASMRDLVLGATWTMDMLMCGCGIGFDTDWDGEIRRPNKYDCEMFIIPDSREGWVESVGRLINAYIPNGGKYPIFDYSQIRTAGLPIRRFGGISSGPDPLRVLHKRIDAYLETYLDFKRMGDCNDSDKHTKTETLVNLVTKLSTVDYPGGNVDDLNTLIQKIRSKPEKTYGKTRCVVDIINAIGSCVVAGNVRRSAEIAIGQPDDPEFMDLKNYELNPERIPIGWVSNNSIRFEKTSDFMMIPDLTRRISVNGEPGFINLINIQKYGRVGRHHHSHPRELENDLASLSNPCGEIPLEPFELCNLAEVFPSRILDQTTNGDFRESFYDALRYATFYTSTVSLLPTHWEVTNQVIARNHRIGVSLTGIANLYSHIGFTRLTELVRKGYKIVSDENVRLANEAGVKPSIRITTVKPSGTLSLIAGVSPGMHFPTSRYAIRRVRIAENSSIVPLLTEAGIPHEKDVVSVGTLVFEFPINNGDSRSASQVSVWEQFSILATLQREWSDNMVSVTITFDENEKDQLEYALAQFAPVIKTCSMLPNLPCGAYPQMPYEEIDQAEYLRRKMAINEIKWSSFGGSDGIMPRNCANDVCDLTP